MEMRVLLEDTGETVTLSLPPDVYARAENDMDFLRNLIYGDGVDSNQPEPNSPSAQETEQEQQQPRDADGNTFIWQKEAILMLLSLFEELKEDFERKRHKGLWDIISTKMKESGYNVTGGQCQSKINCLKRTFKKILDHNNKSGNDRASWPFYDRMMELFGRTGWVQPIAVASEQGSIESPGSSEGQGSVQDTLSVRETPMRRKRKLNDLVAQREKAKEQYRKEREENKKQRFQQLLALKERQHKEKMELISLLLNRNN